ncbi:MAG: SRPBCC family protein [Steroidobacteraceae bacterium]
MEIQQSLRVAFGIDQVWRHFHDVEAIVACLPGAALSAPPSAGRLALSMTIKLGPILAVFAGDGQLLMDELTRCGRITGSGSDRKSGSRLKGEAAFCLHEDSAQSASTRIDIRITYTMAGALAQFSREGIVRELADRLTAEFRDNLQAKLSVEQSKPEPARPLDLGKMLWPMMIARLKRWIGRRGASSNRTPSAGD